VNVTGPAKPSARDRGLLAARSLAAFGSAANFVPEL
jgi:hypothetical protein